MKILSKLKLSFDGCAVAGLVLVGISFLVWGLNSDTLHAQGISLVLCVASWGAAVFIHILARSATANEKAEAEIAAKVAASPANWGRRATDPLPPIEQKSLKEHAHRFFKQLADYFAPEVETANR